MSRRCLASIRSSRSLRSATTSGGSARQGRTANPAGRAAAAIAPDHALPATAALEPPQLPRPRGARERAQDRVRDGARCRRARRPARRSPPRRRPARARPAAGRERRTTSGRTPATAPSPRRQTKVRGASCGCAAHQAACQSGSANGFSAATASARHASTTSAGGVRSKTVTSSAASSTTWWHVTFPVSPG